MLPEHLQPSFPYPKEGRVRSVQLRGEVSMGIALPLGDLPDHFGQEVADLVALADLQEDLSSLLGIEKFEPIIPHHMQGDVEGVPIHVHYSHHDCNQYGTYRDELDFSERVVVTEKLHGSQGIFLFTRGEDGNFELRVSSKGMLRKGLVLREAPGNTYWQACQNAGLLKRVESLSGHSIQVIGEVIPVQKGYTYGQTKITLRIFEVRFEDRILPYDHPDLRCFRTCGCPCFTTENLAKPTSTPSARAKNRCPDRPCTSGKGWWCGLTWTAGPKMESG